MVLQHVPVEGADGYIVKPINEKQLLKYMGDLGLLGTPTQAESLGTPIELIDERCCLDTIPVPVPTRRIQRMAGSIGSQITAQCTSTKTREYQ